MYLKEASSDTFGYNFLREYLLMFGVQSEMTLSYKQLGYMRAFNKKQFINNKESLKTHETSVL